MDEQLTEELLQELLDAPDPEWFLVKYDIDTPTLSDALNDLLAEKGLARAEVIRKAGLNETYGYQIFMGERNPSRNKILQLAFAMGLSFRESNRLLRISGASELYCKNRRDAIIVFCLEHGYDLQRTDEELYRFKQETIC